LSCSRAAGRGRLARALKPHQHDDRQALGRGQGLLAAHQLDELVVAGLGEVVAGGDLQAAGLLAGAGLHLLADTALLHAVEKAADDVEVHVGLEQRHAHVAQRLADVLLAERRHAPEAVTGALEALAEGFQHFGRKLAHRCAAPARCARVRPIRLEPLRGEDCVATEVEAHITGTVFKVETSVGASVSEGEVLVILESMKMEMPVESPVAGKVSEIRVEEGQSVEEDEILVVID
jgi:acetyl-CoA carboxylase biotin carboxyl carrier protein